MDLIEPIPSYGIARLVGAILRAGTFLCLASTVLVLLSGCEQPAFPVAPVHGKVTIDGEPLSSGKVMFAPILQGGGLESGKAGFGPIQSDGTFVVSTYSDNDGAVVGEHWVSIIGSPGIGVSPKFPGIIRVTVPRKFSVASDMDNSLAVELKAQEVKRFGRRKP